jgi:23S rRNA-/tRNA-specific pseudouridylate synthase
VVLFAKDAATHKELSIQFEQHQVRKTYRLLVEGVLDHDGFISKPIKEFGSGRMGVGAGGKDAETRFKVLQPLNGATLVEADPATGRRHQLRVHFYSRRHPVLGDPLYGEKRPVGGAPRLMLHAASLEFNVAGKPIHVHTEPPEDFLAVLKTYGWRMSA